MYNDRLQATLTLGIGTATFSITAGAIETIELTAHTYGFSAEVSFWVSSEGVEDEVLTPFTSTELIQATLAIANGRLALAGETPAVSSFLGFVSERSVAETISKDIAGEPIIERYYTVRFADPAQVFWRAHRPLALFANASMKDVIDANLVKGVAISYEWPRLSQAQDIVCVGLGGASKASFYDFVVSVVSDLCGVIELEAATGTYRLAKDKAAGATATDLDAEVVTALRLDPPVLQRHAGAVLNPFSEASPGKTDVANTLAALGVRRDVIAHTPVAAKVDQRAQLEADRLRQRDHHLHVTFGALPAAFPAPGVVHSIGEGFSKRLLAAGKSYRAIVMRLRAGPPEGDEENDGSNLEDESSVFGLELTTEFERESDPVPVLPPFEPPSYPVLAEGKVLSASGAESDRTWHALSGENDSVVRYRIKVPLWNQTIVAPFVPFGESGHFFFPAYKNQRVLLAFELDSAKIVSFLDWAGKLGTDTQGNQLVMGKRDASSTVMKHVYTDESPILTLVRTQAGDKQTMELSEGRFFLEVKEDETEESSEETYDLTPQADVAKESAAADARSGVDELSGDYESSMAGASGAFGAASAEIEGEVTAATTDLTAQATAVEAQIESKAADMDAAADALDAKVAAAKAELESALEDD